MKAMILAAGLGTRLHPITLTRPKALVETGKKTLLQITIEKLVLAGYDELIINIHHFAPMVKEYLEKNQNFGALITFSDESDQLLDTGGGVLKAAWFFKSDEPFLVHNVDIVSGIDLKLLETAHNHSKPMATLAVSRRKSSRYLLFDEELSLCGWENVKKGALIKVRKPIGKLIRLAFNGIQVIQPALLEKTKLSGVFSLIDFYLELAPQNLIKGHLIKEYVIDAGKPENLEKIKNRLP